MKVKIYKLEKIVLRKGGGFFTVDPNFEKFNLPYGSMSSRKLYKNNYHYTINPFYGAYFRGKNIENNKELDVFCYLKEFYSDYFSKKKNVTKGIREKFKEDMKSLDSILSKLSNNEKPIFEVEKRSEFPFYKFKNGKDLRDFQLLVYLLKV